jgi:ornithine cyclodeaminase/alanine dehydrogenase-like protein (mu-crystallin family)
LKRGVLRFGTIEIGAGLQAMFQKRLQSSVPKHSKIKVATQPKQHIKNTQKMALKINKNGQISDLREEMKWFTNLIFDLFHHVQL